MNILECVQTVKEVEVELVGEGIASKLLEKQCLKRFAIFIHNIDFRRIIISSYDIRYCK